MPEHNPGQMGGTMRLGKRKTIFKNVESVISMYLGQIYNEVQVVGVGGDQRPLMVHIII